MTDNIKLPTLKVGNLPTANQDEYPGLGNWWVQLRCGPSNDDVFARVYGDTPDQAKARAKAVAAVLADRERMKAELDALLKDKARLDKGSILIRVSNGYGGVNEHHYSGKDLRESIDAARSEGDEK